MKLHRIAGRNLASLEAPFEIVLDEGPLAQLGLFAITGPTGSGKSTVLDALCLALYDDTPRLHGPGGAEVGDGADAYGIHDARRLVRRGCDAASAEVEFTGIDEVRYVAQWSVRRRPRVGGFDNPAITLRRVGSSTTEGGRKTETLARIVEVLGLDFKAFAQSVLLAQGDFARMLHAKADARGEALEWITHSELYSDLSRIAYLRATAVEAGLREELAALRGIVRMPDVERDALSNRLSDRRGALSGASVLLHRLQAAKVWHDARASLAAELVRFESTAAEATEAVIALEDLRVQLDVADRAGRVSGPLAVADQAATALQRHDDATPDLEKARANALAAVAPAEAKLGEVNEALRGAVRAQEEGAEPLKAARRLDALVQAATAAGVAASDKLGAVERGLIQAREGLAGAEKLAADKAHRLAQLDAWLAEHPDAVALAPGWSGTGPLLADWAGTLAAGVDEARATEKAKVAADAAAACARDAEAPAQAAADLALEARRARDATVDPEEAVVAAALAAQAGDLHAARQRLAAAEALQQATAALDRRVLDAETAGGAAAQTRVAASARHQAAGAELVVIDARHDEAKQQLRALEARQDLSAHRAALQLQPGQECPLCGATEHHIQADARFDEAVADALARVSQLGVHRDAKTREISGEAAHIEAAELSARTSAAAMRAATAERLALTAQHGTPESADALAASRAWLAARELAHEAAIGAQRQRALDYQRLATAADAARATADQAAATLRQAQQLASTLTVEHLARVAKTGEIGQRADDLAQRLSLALGVFPDWASRYRSAGARSALAAEVAEATTTTLARQDLGKGLAAAATSVAIRKSELLGAVANRDRALAESRAAADTLESLQEQRKGALNEASADAFEASLAGPVQRARALSEERGRELTAARAAAGEAGAVLDAHTNARPALHVANAVAMETLRAALAAVGLSQDEVAASLARGEAWATEGHRRWNEAGAGQTRALLAVADTRRRLAELESAPPAGADADGAPLSDQLAAAEAANAALLVEIGTAQATLAADQARREDYERRDRALGPARADVEAWIELRDTIGDARGKTLRSFAQALTLARLLEEANHVLDELAPRYQLEGVARSPLDLQVIDRERANEARGVNTLSGGETFLLSLAMALGLSNVAARRQPVNCLFIDEGFGALDPKALDQALSMLESLQQRGRTIGIISHVPGLAERVGARVDIVPTGLGTSRVEVVAG